MKRNALIISCSPRAEKGSSNAIAKYLIDKLNFNGVSTDKVILSKEIKDESRIVDHLDKSDVIVLSLPIYENSVPGLVVQLFELIYQFRNKLSVREKQIFVITNSGFAEVSANQSAIEVCRLFADEMGFDWLGGIAVAPGMLFTEDNLYKSKRIYKKLIKSLDMIVESISNSREIPEEAFTLVSKPFINLYLYIVAGYILQKKMIVRKIGKAAYFARPLLMSKTEETA